MPLTLEQYGIDALSVSDRIELIGLLWDSVVDAGHVPPMPEWHRQELQARITRADAEPGAGIPWEVVRARLAKSQ